MANFNELKSILQKHIDEAITEMSNNDEWAEMGWVGDDIQNQMAEAAWAVAMYGKSVNDYLQKEGHIKQ